MDALILPQSMNLFFDCLKRLHSYERCCAVSACYLMLSSNPFVWFIFCQTGCHFLSFKKKKNAAIFFSMSNALMLHEYLSFFFFNQIQSTFKFTAKLYRQCTNTCTLYTDREYIEKKCVDVCATVDHFENNSIIEYRSWRSHIVFYVNLMPSCLPIAKRRGID